MFPARIEQDGFVYALEQADLSAHAVFEIWWAGKYHWKNRLLSTENNAALFSFKQLPEVLDSVKTYGDGAKLFFAAYSEEERKKPPKKECGNCNKYYWHYVKGRGADGYLFSQTRCGHCFPSGRDEVLSPKPDDAPHKKNCFVWRDDLEAAQAGEGKQE